MVGNASLLPTLPSFIKKDEPIMKLNNQNQAKQSGIHTVSGLKAGWQCTYAHHLCETLAESAKQCINGDKDACTQVVDKHNQGAVGCGHYGSQCLAR
jgi:hypothetical protein